MPTPTLRPAAAPVAGLRIFINPIFDVKLENLPQGKFDRWTRSSLVRALTSGGFQLVDAVSAPHDLDLQLRGKCDLDGGFSRMQSHCKVVAALSSSPDSKDVDHFELEYDGTWDVFSLQDYDGESPIGSLLENKLVEAPRVLAFAKSRSSSAPESALAAPSSATSPRPASPAQAFRSATPQRTAYALIIGIEKYRDVPAPSGAHDDAVRFADLARQTLGIPESQVVVALDDRASKGDIEKHLNWLKGNATAGSRVYFYFSGHGAPEPSSGTSYLLPYDGDPKALDQTALKLGDVMASLSETKAKEVLAVVDSCFSGAGGRSVLPPGARPLTRVKETTAPARLALFSAASGSEISGPIPGGSGGLFTHVITDALGTGQADIDGDGQITLQELSEWVSPRVSREAKRDNRDQNPSLAFSGDLGTPAGFVVEWGVSKR